MNIRLLPLALLVMPALAGAQIEVKISFPTPPPLVVVSPGIQVVPELEEEVFYVDGWYWLRRDTHWFRTRDHRGGWVVVDPPLVPVDLVRVPPGHYRHWRKEEEKAERRAIREEEKAEHRALKAEEKWRKQEEKAEKKGGKPAKKRGKR